MKTSSPTDPILLGTMTGEAEQPLKVFYDNVLHPYRAKPWLLHWLDHRDGKKILPEKGASGGITIPGDLLTTHGLLVGKSGSGKSRLALHLFREQLRRGCSGVILDVKATTIRHAIQCALDAGLTKEQITVVWPDDENPIIPGWNPFVVPALDIEKTAGLFTSTLRKPEWGERMTDLLKNACTVIAGQHLSLWEVVQLIRPTNEAYRAAILNQARGSEAWELYPVNHDFFKNEYVQAVRKSESPASVITRLTTLVSNRHLRAMLCAREDQLDLASLWKQQRVVLVHLNEDTLTPEGAGILAGLVAQSLFYISMRKPGNVPVTVVMDELESLERYLGDGLGNILSKSREQGIRMIGACQNIEQMSPKLRRLFMNTSVRCFFKLDHKDATLVADELSTGMGGRDIRANVTAHPDATVAIPADVTGADGTRLSVPMASWRIHERDGKGSLASVRIMGKMMRMAELFALSPLDGSLIPLESYLKGVSLSSYRFTGPDPVRAVVTFPRPIYKTEEKESAKERQDRMAQVLSNLPAREAVVKVDSGRAVHIAVTDVEFSGMPDPSDFIGNAQTAAEITQTARARTEAVERLSGTKPAKDIPTYKEISDDGNL
jgi:hypothetical protein